MSRESRQQVQAALNLLGFDAGVEDGVIGRGTRAAIRAYQAAKGAPTTGYITPTQLRDLTGIYAQAVRDGNPNLSRPLTKQEFQQLQSGLKSLGYYTGAIDGIVGRGTSRAILRYANDRGVDANSVSTAQVLEMVLAETTSDTRETAQTAGLSSNFIIDGSKLTVEVENLDPNLRYSVVLLDPFQQGDTIRQYFSHAPISRRTGGRISFNLAYANSDALDVWLKGADDQAPILDKLTIRRGSPEAADGIMAVDGVKVDFGQNMPLELTGAPFSVGLSGLELGPFYRIVVREMSAQAGGDGAIVWDNPNQVFTGGIARKLEFSVPKAGHYRFDIEAMKTSAGYVPIVQIPIEVVAAPGQDDTFRWIAAPQSDGDFTPAGVKDDLFLGRYEGAFNCGPSNAEWYGGKIDLQVTEVATLGRRVDVSGHLTIMSPDGGKVLFSAGVGASGSRFSERLLNLHPRIDPEFAQSEDVVPFNWTYSLQFDRNFNTATLTPTKSTMLTKTECPSSKLTRTADSPIFIAGNPKAPQVTEFCRDTRTAQGVAACVQAAAKAWQTDGVLIAINRLDDVKAAASRISPPQCSKMLEDFDQVLFSIAQEYGVPFGFEVKTCPQLLEVTAAMGFARPAPEVCDVQRSITQDWLSSCLRALSDIGHSAQVKKLIRDASNACINGPEGAVRGTPLIGVLASQRVFSGGDHERQRARLNRELDCRDVVRVAEDFGAVNTSAAETYIREADTAEIYACSQERADTPPTRLDMIQALGREIGRRCSPDFLMKSWLADDGNDMTPFTAALFDFTPTESSCQLRFRLTSTAAAPAYSFWAGGYESAQCRANGRGRFDCVGDFETGFGSNDPRPGASVLNSLIANQSRPLAVSFHFDKTDCEWRAYDIRRM